MLRSKCVRRAYGALTLGMPGRALDANRVTLCAPLCSSQCSQERARRAVGSLGGEMRVGAEGEPPQPPPGPRSACHWPGQPGGREDDISGRLDYKGVSRAAGSKHTQPAPRSSGTRVRTAAPPACSEPAYAPALAAAGVRPSTPRAPCTSPSCWPALCCSRYSRSGPPKPSPGRHRRWVLLQGWRDCEGLCGCAGGLGGCGSQEGAERAGRRPFPLRCVRVTAGEPSKPGFGVYVPSLGRTSTDGQPLLHCGQPSKRERRGGQGTPRRSGHGGRVAGGCRAELSRIYRNELRARKGQTALLGAWGWSIRAPALPLCVPSPACSFPRTGPANSARGGAGRVPR